MVTLMAVRWPGGRHSLDQTPSENRFINLEMVHDGFACRYVRYDKAGEFTDAEREAREKHRGLWTDPNPVPPWKYRRERRAAPKSRP
jgi:endonuclease YncB( thermonuclease family)